MDNELKEMLEQRTVNGISYRNMQNIEIRELGEGEEDKKTVRGYATTFNSQYRLYSYTDWNGNDTTVFEQVDRNAFQECEMSDVIMQYDHRGRVFARQRNNTLRLSTDDHGLLVEADLGGTSIGRQLYEEIKGGYTDKMSFGFIVGEDELKDTCDKENHKRTIIRTITKISRLFDVSAVSLPANDGTEISARSFVDGLLERDKAEAKKAEERAKAKQKIKILCEVNKNGNSRNVR